MPKNQHVVRNGDEWAVRGEGNERLTSTHRTQAEAIEAARKIARKRKGELVIHRSDGRIRDRDSYSDDPLPPKSPRKVIFPTTSGETEPDKIRNAVKEVLSERGQTGNSFPSRDRRH